ncbi:sigma-70 family RNA polymerase sigma factor [Vibrio parahaemolyticus]|nr:sigma-70 family RNA polymerase sigma factor [Vibrio parahaemolyticus]
MSNYMKGTFKGYDRHLLTLCPFEKEALLAYMNSIGAHSLLTAEEEVELTIKAQDGCKRSRERMITSNLRLVVKVAKTYSKRPLYSLTPLDIINEGNLGLMKAIEKYDPKMGHRFSTYAAWWIRDSINNALVKQAKLVRIPVDVTRELSALSIEANKITSESRTGGTTTKLSKALNSSAEKINQLVSINGLDIDTTASFEQIQAPLDEMLSHSAIDPEEDQANTQANIILMEIIGDLPERIKHIIMRRFGLDGGDGITLQALSDSMGLSRERISQLQKQGLTLIQSQLLQASVEELTAI